MLQPPERERFTPPQNNLKTLCRLALFCALMSMGTAANAAQTSSIYDKPKDDIGNPSKPDNNFIEIESKICGFSGFFSIIDKEGEKIIVMHSGCTTYDGKKPVKAEFTHGSDTIIKANENAEFMISEGVYIFLSDGEPVLSYINGDDKRVNMLIPKTNNVYNMRKYLKYLK